MKPIRTIFAGAAALALAMGTAQFASASGLQHVADDHKSFEEVDANGDGQITPEEAEAAGVNIDWDKADPAGNGSLTRDEYENAMQDQDSDSDSSM